MHAHGVVEHRERAAVGEQLADERRSGRYRHPGLVAGRLGERAQQPAERVGVGFDAVRGNRQQRGEIALGRRDGRRVVDERTNRRFASDRPHPFGLALGPAALHSDPPRLPDRDRARDQRDDERGRGRDHDPSQAPVAARLHRGTGRNLVLDALAAGERRVDERALTRGDRRAGCEPFLGGA